MVIDVNIRDYFRLENLASSTSIRAVHCDEQVEFPIRASQHPAAAFEMAQAGRHTIFDHHLYLEVFLFKRQPKTDQRTYCISIGSNMRQDQDPVR
jgi:hypothetical protein